MKQLVNKLNRYFKIYRQFAKFSLLDILAYRLNSLLIGVAPIIWLAIMLLFLKIIYGGISQLGGWSLWEVIFLTAVQEMIFVISWITFNYNFDIFSQEVKNGRFDLVLLKPINHQFMVSFRLLDFTAILSLFNTLAIFIYSWLHLNRDFNFGRIIGFIFLLAIGYGFSYYVNFIFACLNLFFTSARNITAIMGEMMDFGRYPAEIYQSWFRKFILYFIPILFYAYIPTAYLLGKISSLYILYALIVLVVFFLLSKYIWQAGLRHYQSASS